MSGHAPTSRTWGLRTRVLVAAGAALVLLAVAVFWAVNRPDPQVAVDPTVTLDAPGAVVRDPTTGRLAVVLDVLGSDLVVQRSLPVNGIPTRARVSADGWMLAWTVFVSGDSYTTSGFSTRSGILDLATDVPTTSLEDFAVTDEDGVETSPPRDANFWGLSFADDDNTFYATMSTGAHCYLVQGDFAAETVTVPTDGVECPSPDGTRVVDKRRLPDLT